MTCSSSAAPRLGPPSPSPSAHGPGYPALKPQLWGLEDGTWGNLALHEEILSSDKSPYLVPGANLNLFPQTPGVSLHRVAMGGHLLGLAGRGTDAKLEQPGAQQVEPVPGTASPTPGRAGWQRLPARGTQPVPASLPRLPTFPRCHPPLLIPPSQQQGSAQGSGTRKQGMPFPCHPWVPRLLRFLTISNQRAPGE